MLMAGEIPDWIPAYVINDPSSPAAQEYFGNIAIGSVNVPGNTPDEIAVNLTLLEQLTQGVQES